MQDDKQDHQEIGADDVGQLPAERAPVDGLLERYRQHIAGLAVDDPAEVAERILANILTASTAHDILHAGEALPAKELVNIPLHIVGIRAAESTVDEGGDWYLHVDAKVIASGDSVTFSCGAQDVVAKLVALDMRQLLPVDAQLELATRPTQAGYFPMFLRALRDDGEPF